MNTMYAVVVVFASAIAVVVIPAYVHRWNTGSKVVERKGALERALLMLTSIGFFLALFWAATPWLQFADYALQPAPFFLGISCILLGLWFLYRSHADLGANWSITLEVREEHRLVTEGIYRRVRHPMYLSLLLYAAGLALVLPNWLAGPAYLVAMVLLFALRVGPEERMMLDQFGKEYEAYRARTKRLVPGVW